MTVKRMKVEKEMSDEEYIKSIIECAKMIDITKLDDKMLEEVARSKRFSNLPKKLQCDIMLIACVLKQAQLNKRLSEKEVIEAVNDFYIELCLEYLVRKGLMKRIGKWGYKSFGKCAYKLTKKGEKEGKKLFEKLKRKWEKENLTYIG
jgi:hypothetical protein